MIRCSIERAWLRPGSSVPARVEGYLARLPELGGLPGVLAELQAAERDSRLRAIRREYRSRYPDLRPEPAPEAAFALADFEILEELGRGTMGVVYRARQKHLGREVALKILYLGTTAGLDNRQRFEQEARLSAGCEHPHIVRLFEAGEVDGVPYLALEFCPGGSLEKRLDQRRLSAKEAAGLLATLARAVHHARQAGVVHRDLKPANILFAADGSPRVADFGLARLQEGAAEFTPPTAAVGTPAYAAPEQLGRSLGATSTVGSATDVYALGGILYRCLVGRLPFVGATVNEVITAKLTGEPPLLRQIERSVPRDLETICLKCLQRDPARRYSTAQALADDLERYLTGQPIAARPAGQIERTLRWCGRNPALASLFGVLMAAVLVFAGMFGWADSERRRADTAGREATQHLQTACEVLRQFALQVKDGRYRRGGLAAETVRRVPSGPDRKPGATRPDPGRGADRSGERDGRRCPCCEPKRIGARNVARRFAESPTTRLKYRKR